MESVSVQGTVLGRWIEMPNRGHSRGCDRNPTAGEGAQADVITDVHPN
jgi:hypothetical protein